MRRAESSGRETGVAESSRRHVFYGYGSSTTVEKNGFGRFLDDVVRVYAEVSVFALPVLLSIMEYPAGGWFDAKATGLLAWSTMTLVGALIRGGWLQPLWTETPGWVTLRPWLLVLRVGYRPVVFALAVFGGYWLAGVAGVVAGSVWTVTVAAGGMAVFPRVAEQWLALWTAPYE